MSWEGSRRGTESKRVDESTSMTLKLHFLNFNVDDFSKQLPIESDEQGNCFTNLQWPWKNGTEVISFWWSHKVCWWSHKTPLYDLNKDNPV